MNVTLLDEQGNELTEITSHLGRSTGQMLIDWATRPDALFEYYFDRGKRAVTAVVGTASWSTVLGTRWQMGTRRWFLHEFRLVQAHSSSTARTRTNPDSPPGGRDRPAFTCVRSHRAS